jgi:type IV pilus assembly protein PilO
MKLSDLNNLDINNIGSWPVPIKLVVVLLLVAAIGGAGYYFDTQHMIADLKKTEAREVELRRTFEQKWNKVANLDAFRAQLEEMNKSFGAMLRQLPDKTEVADLLVDISQTGLANGLEFQLFKPGGEVRKGFYAELPIQIQVTGTYHQLGAFVSGIAALPRIVTMHDMTIKPQQSGGSGKSAMLSMDAVAKTYRYLEEAPQ